MPGGAVTQRGRMSFDDRVLHLSSGLCTVVTTADGPPRTPPLVLLHAWAESRRSFCRLAPLLHGRCTIAVDQRGHGDADKPVDGHALPELAADVVAALDALDVERAVLVGSSSGGYVAQQVAVDAPGCVAGLVLVGSPHDLRGEAPFAAEVRALRDPVDPAWVRRFVSGFASDLVPPSFVELMAVEALRLPAAVWRASLAGLTGSTPPTEAGSIGAPTLVVSGDRDGLTGRAHASALVSAIPGAQWLEYGNTGHAVLWERPHRLASDIQDFLDALDAPPEVARIRDGARSGG